MDEVEYLDRNGDVWVWSPEEPDLMQGRSRGGRWSLAYIMRECGPLRLFADEKAIAAAVNERDSLIHRAKMLAATPRPGDPCPGCGYLEMTHGEGCRVFAIGILTHQLNLTQDAAETATNQLTDAAATVTDLRAQLGTARQDALETLADRLGEHADQLRQRFGDREPRHSARIGGIAEAAQWARQVAKEAG